MGELMQWIDGTSKAISKETGKNAWKKACCEWILN
jgi:hypothetical protein